MKLRRSRNIQTQLLNYAFRLGAVQTAITQGTIQPRTEAIPPPEPSTSEPLQKDPDYFKRLEKMLEKAFPDIYEQDSDDDDVSIPGSWASECSHN